MYTLEQLRGRTFKELKEIGWQFNVLPAGDRRCRQNWIDAIAGVNPPLLALLEVSPGVEVESVAEAHEVQRQEPIALAVESSPAALECPHCGAVHALYSTLDCLDKWVIRCLHCSYGRHKNYLGPIRLEAQEPIEYGRITGYLCCPKPIAPAVETLNGVENCSEADRPPNRGDNGRGRIESDPKLSQSAMAFRPRSCYGCDDSQAVTGITFSPRFLATYPPYFGEIRYKAEVTGQLNLLEPETTEEPPDPDDYEGDMFAFWAAYDAWCEQTDDDSEQFEPLEISLTSMCEWAPCPLDWYEPAFTNETVSCTLEISSMLELPILFDICANESSSTCNFSIPTFDARCDRPNGKDEPPMAGVGARLPKPKHPSFPPASVAPGDRTNGKKIARSAILLSGRAPPGGDAM